MARALSGFVPRVAEVVVEASWLSREDGREGPLDARVSTALASRPDALLIDLGAVETIAPAALPALFRSIEAAAELTRVVVVAKRPGLRALLLGAKEFARARLFATRAAALASLGP